MILEIFSLVKNDTTYVNIVCKIKFSVLYDKCYNLGQEEEETTDAEDLNDLGFFRRKTQFGIRNHGNVIVYVGKQFTVHQGKHKDHPYFKNKKDNKSLVTGKIAHIVSHIDEPSILWFAFYDCERHRRQPQCPDDWHYAKCEDFISSKLKLIKWDTSALVGTQLVGRTVCVYFGSHARYYNGKVTHFSKENKKKPYEVLFEDGEVHSFSETKIIQCMR